LTFDATISEIQAIVRTLRTQWATIHGDGFGRAGTLRGEFKKTVRRLENLQIMLELGPLEEPPEDANPDCCGHLADNIPGCTCRLIGATLKS